MKQWRAKAPAKINLTLDITGIQENGYHQLASCFHSLDLADELMVFLTKQQTIFREWSVQFSSSRRISFTFNPIKSSFAFNGLFIIGGPIPLQADENNLVLRAIEIFMQRLSNQSQLDVVDSLKEKAHLFMGVYIEKKIPFEAGLGGGSADAAAILRILNKIFAYPFGFDELIEMGAMLGMDVPFSIIGGAAELNGIGYELTPVSSTLKFPVLLFKPLQGMPTSNAYAKIDAMPASQKKDERLDHETFMRMFRQGKYRKALSYGGNIFQALIPSYIPELKTVYTFLYEQGSILTTLCGSGSCSFSIFTNRQALYRAKRELCKKYPDWWIKSTMLNPLPHQDYLPIDCYPHSGSFPNELLHT